MTADDIDAQESGGGPLRWLGLFAAILGTIMALGMIAGFASASADHGFSPRDGAILAAMVSLAGGLGLLAYRMGTKLLGSKAKVPSRERRSRNILIVSGILGMVLGIILAGSDLMSGSNDPLAVLSDSPMPPALAIGLTLFVILVLPVLGWQWQKAVDEHERQAYQAGAVAAAYMFLVLAPCWWLLWRGDLVPAPNGIVLYFAFDFTFLIVWFWKKYS